MKTFSATIFLTTMFSGPVFSVTLLLLGAACQAPDSGHASPVTVVEQEEGFLIKEGEADVLFYQLTPKSADGEYERNNYIHPLHDLDGEVITEDFPPDHLHQRGIFWAWHQVFVGDERLGDQWGLEDSEWAVESREILESGADSAAVQVKFFWQSARWLDDEGKKKPFVEETTTVRVHRAESDMRQVDFEISLLALEDDVRIGGSEDEKGYGGFSARIRLPEGVRFLGSTGALTPETNQIDAGRWVDIVARFGPSGGESGLAILTHPTLPGFPQPWILRTSGSMQNPVYPGREPALLPRDKALTLRYRLVVHRGALDRARLDQLQSEYETEVVAAPQGSLASP